MSNSLQKLLDLSCDSFLSHFNELVEEHVVLPDTQFKSGEQQKQGLMQKNHHNMDLYKKRVLAGYQAIIDELK